MTYGTTFPRKMQLFFPIFLIFFIFPSQVDPDARMEEPEQAVDDWFLRQRFQGIGVGSQLALVTLGAVLGGVGGHAVGFEIK